MHSVSAAAAQPGAPDANVGEVPGAPGPGAVAGPGAPLSELPAKPAGEPADDLRQREEGGDEVAGWPEAADWP
jgi:hypothetical protein